MTQRFLEGNQIIAGFVPVDASVAANNGDWISLKNFGKVVSVILKAAGTAGDDPVITLKQATDNTGTGAKALNFDTIWSKVGAQASTLQFTKNTQVAANTYTDTVSAEAQAIFAIETRAEELDVANGFTCIQLSVPDVGANAQLVTAFHLCLEPRFAVEPSLGAQ